MVFTQEMFAKHMRPITGSAIREIFKLLAKPGMISFAGGNPSNTALEPEVVSDLAREALEKYGTGGACEVRHVAFAVRRDGRLQPLPRIGGGVPARLVGEL